MSSDDILSKYQEYLSANSRQLTREREIIVQQICTTPGLPFDVVSLCERLSNRESGRRVSRSTVYRTLRDLEAIGVLRSAIQQDGVPVYEWVIDSGS